MAAMSPGDRKAARESSQLNTKPLDDPDIRRALSSLRDIFLTSFGPQGHSKVIHNDCGGHVMLTSSSSRILSSLSTTKPVIKLVCSTLQDHLQAYSDGGCLAAVLGLQLILKGLDLKIHRRIIIEIYDMLLEECLNYLQSDDCPVKKSFDFQNSTEMLNFIKHLFQSKPACLLFGLDLDHMCKLTLESFLSTLPKADSRSQLNRNSNNLLYVSVEGRPVQESQIFSGILFQTPNIPVYRKNPLEKLKRCKDGKLKIALVETSMAGDSDSFLEVTYQISDGVSLVDSVLEKLLVFARALVDCGIAVLACQRVVHPRIKRELKQTDVLVLERMGREHFSALRKLTDGDVLDPFSSQRPSNLSTKLLDVTHIVLGNKSYILLTGDPDGCHGDHINTLVLCHRSEEAVSELKTLCQSIPHILQHMMVRPWVLCGASCWLTTLSYHIHNKMSFLTTEYTDTLGCSPLHAQSVIDTFVSVLRSPVLSQARTKRTVPAVDISTGHLFTVEGVPTKSDLFCCQCGAVSYDDKSEFAYEYLGNSSSKNPVQIRNTNVNKCDIVTDSLTTSLGMLKTAVGIGCMVLGIQHFVQDVN